MGRGEFEMLKELVAYYDCLINQPDSGFVPEGYSKVCNVANKIVLSKEGKLKDILPNTYTEVIGKKEKNIGNDEIFPFRYSVSGISAETIECREKYIFGFEWDKETKKLHITKNSLSAFNKSKEKNIDFLRDLSSDVIDAYKAFLENWNPEKELNNPILKSLGKLYAGAKFIIVVEGSEGRTKAIHEDPLVKDKWEKYWQTRGVSSEKDAVIAQCSISGEMAPIARIHNKLTGIAGGNSTGSNLICFNESASCSYGKEQSFNSFVSTAVMEKYTKVFNYLSSSKSHNRVIDDMTFLFWTNTKDKEIQYLDDFLCELWDADEQIEETVNDISKGSINDVKKETDDNVEFCILGVKPNNSRLAIKFFEKDSFGSIMSRIKKHQEDMRICENDKQMTIRQILHELKSPKSEKDSISPDLSAKILIAILKNRPYPDYLLQTVVRRVKTDQDDDKKFFKSVNSRRARIIKAHLVRTGYYKGGEYMIESKNQTDAFRCGRLFAVLEKIQKVALHDINSTIKDKFFASACATPDLVFIRLVKLAQSHLAKMDKGQAIYYDKLLQEIMSEIVNFPTALSVQKQGDFILGYYQQKQNLFASNNKTEGEDE